MNAIFHHAVRKFSWKIYAINQVVRKTVFELLDWPPKCQPLGRLQKYPTVSQHSIQTPTKYEKSTIFIFFFSNIFL